MGREEMHNSHLHAAPDANLSVRRLHSSIVVPGYRVWCYFLPRTQHEIHDCGSMFVGCDSTRHDWACGLPVNYLESLEATLISSAQTLRDPSPTSAAAR
nr:hypothetical protein CFP56_56001 [Quercus suber]